MLKEQDYHIVHAHSSKAGFLGRLAAKLAGVPIVLYTPHSFSFQARNSLLINRFYIALERFAARLTDRIVTVSCFEKRAAIERRVCHPSILEVIENGVNMQVFQIEPSLGKLRRELGIEDNKQVVGTVAMFCPQKGIMSS